MWRGLEVYVLRLEYHGIPYFERLLKIHDYEMITLVGN